MKLSDVEIGKRYVVKVSGRLQVVRVTEIQEIPAAAWSRRARARTLIHAVNETTGRALAIRSPLRLRSRVEG